jgi:hypothetical protein
MCQEDRINILRMMTATSNKTLASTNTKTVGSVLMTLTGRTAKEFFLETLTKMLGKYIQGEINSIYRSVLIWCICCNRFFVHTSKVVLLLVWPLVVLHCTINTCASIGRRRI